MSINTNLDSQIHRLRKRVRLLLVERYGLFGGGVGAVLAACMAILSTRVTALLDYRIWAGTVLAGVLGGCVFALTRPLKDLTIAIAADKRTGLKERLSTAVALSSVGNARCRVPSVGKQDTTADGNGTRQRAFPTGFEEALVSDANEHISGLKASEVFRHRFGEPHIAFFAAVVLLLGVTFLPQMDRFTTHAKQREIAVMKQEGAKIRKVGKEIEKRSAGDRQKELKKLAGKLEELGRKMQTGRLPKKEAMIQVQRVNKQIKAEQDRLARENSSTKSMSQAQAEMKKASQELARNMAEKMAEKQNIPPSEALQKMASDKRMAELAQKAAPLTQSERKELERAVQKYADPSSSLPIPKELGEALAKLAENEDFKKASELMQKLTAKAQSGQMKELDREALQAQLDALAKVLQNTDLGKLAKMMRENAEKLAKMSPEELAKMAKDMQDMQQIAQILAQANQMSKDTGSAIGQSGLAGQMASGGKGGKQDEGQSGKSPGGGSGGDDANTGPKGKLHDVKDVSHSPSALGESGSVFSAGESKGAPTASSPAAVPYTDVYSNYRKSAERALSKEKVPPAYRNRVKDYFSSLE